MKIRKLKRITAICLALGMILMPMGQAFANEETQTTEVISTVEGTDDTEGVIELEKVTEPETVQETETVEESEMETSDVHEPETEETEEETTEAEEVIEEDDDIAFEGVFYNDSLSTEEREQVLKEISQIERPENYLANTYSSQSECASYLREQMSLRCNYVAFNLYSNTYYDSNVIYKAILTEAYEHTGISYEGDAIKFDDKGAVVTIVRKGFTNGDYQYEFVYNIAYKSNTQQEQALRTAVKNKTAELCNGVSSEYEKIRRIYDFICSTVSFDHENVDDDDYFLKYTAYAAMINHTAICQGYATLFYRMCLEAGIDTRVVRNATHGWNIVRLGNVYYYVDATWDEYADKSILKKNFAWFLKSSADFPKHGDDKVYGSIPLSSYPISQNSYPVPKEDQMYIGLYPSNGIWYYVEGETINRNFSGLSLYNGRWYYVQNGVLNWNYTGLAKHGVGWYYVKNGCVDLTYTGLTQYYGTWYYVQNGVLTWKYYGLAKYGGSWYYIEKSCINWKYTGLAQRNGEWYYVQNGCVNSKYTGLTKYYGTWYYVQNGYLNKGYNGLAKYNGTWYYIQNGSLNWNYTGLTYYIDCWYYIQSGTLTFKYTGITNYYGTRYFVRNSTVAWSYSGTFTQNGYIYVIRNGRVVSCY